MRTLVTLACLGLICATEASAPEVEFDSVAEFCGYPETFGVSPQTEHPTAYLGELREVPITDGTISYYRFGPAKDRPPLILIAEIGNTMGKWSARLLEALTQHQEVIIFNNRGMGSSKDYTSTPFTVKSIARDTKEFIEGLNLDVKPNIMGVSFGGFISLASVALYGESIDSAIVIVGSAGSSNSPPVSDRAISVITSPTATPLMILGAYYPLQYRDAAEAACRVYFDPDNVAPDIVNQTTLTRQTGAVLDFFYAETDIWNAVPRITNNLLLIGAENDTIIPVQGLEKVAERAQNPWLVIFKEAGHGVLHQYDQAIVDLMETFLAWSSRT